MRIKTDTALARVGLLAVALGGLAACNTTQVPPTPDSLGPPPPLTVRAVPSVIYNDQVSGDQITVVHGETSRGAPVTQVLGQNAGGRNCRPGEDCPRTSGSYAVTSQLGDGKTTSYYAESQGERGRQEISVEPVDRRGGGAAVSGVDHASGRHWEVVDPAGRDGPNFIAADPNANNGRGNVYSITTEPDGSGDKTRQNDFAGPSDLEMRSRIERARSGLPKKDDRRR